ncbi:MAG: hypothetical protein IKT99_05340 [Oscillospiraceae bacterium]|nr:hypothetical protein [Oscillospiraceae bacterium]
MSIRNKKAPDGGKHYLISLHVWRSKMALAACILTLGASLAMIGKGMVEMTADGADVAELFHYFTINSNFLTALASAAIIPYAIDGMRKKRFTYPKWTALLHYCGTVCTTLTMIFAVCLISWVDFQLAFGGNNLFLHIICPTLVLVAFFLVESDSRFTVRDTLIGLIPFVLYCCIYLFEVVILGPERGGWPDFYHFTEIVPIYVSLPGMCLLAFGIATAIRLISNRLNAARRRRLTALWRGDADPVEVKIEVYGLGRFTGRSCDKNNLTIPLDILEMLSDRYGIKTEDLIKVYAKGVSDAITQK